MGDGELRKLIKELVTFSGPCVAHNVMNWGFHGALPTTVAGFVRLEREGIKISSATAKLEFEDKQVLGIH